MNSRITVVIPAHDRAGLLGRALESVVRQSLAPAQCLVVDDGSTDGTRAGVLESWPWATCLTQPHRGVSAARNLGIRRASGDWIAFLDSDDCWMPDKLERQMRALQATGDVICHTEEIWIRRGRRVNPMTKHRKHGGRIYRRCLPRCAISPSTALVRRDVLLEAGGFDERLPACEDYDLWLRLCARYPVTLVDEPLATRHAGHPDQLSARYWGMDRFRVRALEKMLDEPALAADDRRATLETLIDKLTILVEGARKRGNGELLRAFEPRLRRCLEAREAAVHGTPMAVRHAG